MINCLEASLLSYCVFLHRTFFLVVDLDSLLLDLWMKASVNI